MIVGGGFAGLEAARRLARAPVDVVLVDRRNHHLFQPLLYQVATAALSPADIAQPIRHILSDQRHARVVLGEVRRIEPDERRVVLRDGEIGYDYLVVAAGSATSYFGHDDWAEHAPALKTVDDAREIRRRFLLAFEAAERESDDAARRAELTFVIIGAGPTGVELAGAIMEIARRAIPRDFRDIDTTTARVVLVEAGDRVLQQFEPEASRRAHADLERLGVEIRLNTMAVEIDDRGVEVKTPDDEHERIDARNVVWAAGVKASPIAESLGAPLDDGGRVEVEPDLSVPGRREVFVVGDLARVADPDTGEEVPGMAPGALQMGGFVGRLIKAEVEGATDRPTFRYTDKGALATIGRGKAVATLWGRTFGGFLAWLLWAGVHIFFLIGFRNRVAVVLEWLWQYATWQRGARLITGDVDAGEEVRTPRVEVPAGTTSLDKR